jgi:hypothetical protein
MVIVHYGISPPLNSLQVFKKCIFLRERKPTIVKRIGLHSYRRRIFDMAILRFIAGNVEKAENAGFYVASANQHSSKKDMCIINFKDK